MRVPARAGGWTKFWASGAMVMMLPPLTAIWNEMNWAFCCPQLPPPLREKGAASGVKNTPASWTPAPPLIWNLLLEASDHRPSPAKGPSVDASQVGGAPPAILMNPEFW